MSEQSVLIVGANRGIGLNLARAFTAAKSWNVTGSIRPQTRNDASVKDLEETGARILEIDFLDEKSIESAAAVYGDVALDVLINVGGLSPEPKPWYENTAEMLMERFRVMTVGPFLTTKHFLPKLEKSPRARVVNISSDFGSISNNKTGLYLSYRLAKTALNQQTVTLAQEFLLSAQKQDKKNPVIVVAMEPGFVATRLTNWDFVDDMEACVRGVLEVVEGLDVGDTGKFFDWRGDLVGF